MKYTLKHLRPKINRLHSCIVAQIHNVSQNQVLCASIEEMLNEGHFPKPVTLFVKLPLFEKLISNMHRGFFVCFDTIDRSCYPIEHKNLQILIRTFHKLIHLDYEPIRAKKPILQGKILSTRIMNILEVLDLIAPHNGKQIQAIADCLYDMVSEDCEALCALTENFPLQIQEAMQAKVVSHIRDIQEKGYSASLLESWAKVCLVFTQDFSLLEEYEAMQRKAVKEIRRQLNHLSGQVFRMYRQYDRGLVTLFPHAIRDTSDPQEIMAFYEEETTALLQLQEQALQETICEHWAGVSQTQQFLSQKVQDLSPFLPKTFVESYRGLLGECDPGWGLWHSDKPLGQIFLMGCYISHINLLLNALEGSILAECPKELPKSLIAFGGFLDTYFRMQPLMGSSLQKELLLDADATGKSLLFPQNLPHTQCLQQMNTILSLAQELLKELTPDGSEKVLLIEVLSKLGHMDIPSYVPNWFVLGELAGVYSSLLMHCNPKDKNNPVKHIFDKQRYSSISLLFPPE